MDYENMQEENEVMQLAEEAGIDENWLRDFKVGMAIGLCCPAEVEKKSVPIAYLYGHVAKEGEAHTHTINGVDYVGAVLPPLPADWNQENYPYAYIIDDRLHTNAWYLVVLSEKAFHHDWWLPIINSGMSAPEEYGDNTEIISYKCDTERMAWEYYGALSVQTISWMYNKPIVWANKNIPHCEYVNDVYVESGVFFAESEPVPIYGGE